MLKLNGKVRRDPETPVDLEADRIEVDGHQIAGQEMKYLMLNKPRGIITSAADEQGRKTVYCLLPRDLPWVGPVGRLDKASEGLLLLTNDSEWAARVSAPETGVHKIYHVQVACVGDEKLVDQITRGAVSTEGQRLRAKSAAILRSGEKNTWLEIVLEEGKNRHIRRMLAGLGVEVLRLVRVAIGPLILGDLSRGAVRSLTQAEKRKLDAAMNHKPAPTGKFSSLKRRVM
jgi:23S rRNA pseudouridine2605 synthase